MGYVIGLRYTVFLSQELCTKVSDFTLPVNKMIPVHLSIKVLLICKDDFICYAVKHSVFGFIPL